MNNIQVAIIEDEKPAARLLEGMIKKLRPQWDIIKIPGSIESSVAWFASHPHPDIVFLDIQLSDGNSFLFIEQVCPTSLIIFTTAYDEYAVRAFTVNSIDYLLNPIRQERLIGSTPFPHVSRQEIQDPFPYFRQRETDHFTGGGYRLLLFIKQDHLRCHTPKQGVHNRFPAG